MSSSSSSPPHRQQPSSTPAEASSAKMGYMSPPERFSGRLPSSVDANGVWEAIIQSAFDVARNRTNSSSPMDTAVSNELWSDANGALALLLKLVLECARDASPESIFQQKLEDAECKDSPMMEAVEMYKTHKEDIRTRGALQTEVLDLPKLVDMRWRVQYSVHSPSKGRLNQTSVLVNLLYLDPDQGILGKEFVCGPHEFDQLLQEVSNATSAVRRAVYIT